LNLHGEKGGVAQHELLELKNFEKWHIYMVSCVVFSVYLTSLYVCLDKYESKLRRW